MDKDTLYTRLIAEAADDGVRQLVVGAVIQHEDGVLLLRRPKDDFMGGIFELPSGKVEAQEPLDVALTREVEEETGLSVSRIGDHLGHFDYEGGSGRKSRQFNFVVDVASPGPVVLSEHDAFRWSALADAPPVTDAVRKVLEEYRLRVLS